MVLGDRPYFDRSGGAGTLSGGEPTLQAPFLLELLERLQAHGVHTALETCGLFPTRLQEPLVELVDPQRDAFERQGIGQR